MKGNAKIKRTHLGYEDHGIVTCFLYLEQGCVNQGFGGFGLGNGDTVDKGTFWVKRILDTVGVSAWEDLPGKYIRVEGEDHGAIKGIGHIIEDKWFFPASELK